jgi:hypothetical protein
VTQSTRVRIEVLKALSKKLTTPTETAYVQGFISRPLLQYRVVDGCQSSASGVGRGYNFVDAMAKFGTKLSSSDLSLAYVRAGTTFTGAMSQYFVVLEDKFVVQGGPTGINRAPLGRRGARGTSTRRGGPPFRPHVTPEAISERGTKRQGDPASGPSKKSENELVDVAE